MGKFVKSSLTTWLPLAVVLVSLWGTPFVYPIEAFVTVIHELSHAVVTWSLGGTVTEIVISSDNTGHTGIAFPNNGLVDLKYFLALNAGYVGSVICGGVILLTMSRARFKRGVSFVIGVLLLASLLKASHFWSIVAIGGFGSAMLFAAFKLPEWINDWGLRVLGFSGSFCAVLDIRRAAFRAENYLYDAMYLERLTGVLRGFWEMCWFVLSVVATLFFVYVASQKTVTSTNESA